MITSLKRRLATLLIAAICLMLLLSSGAALLVSENQLSLREQVSFEGTLNVLAQDVRMERSLSSAQLAKAEVSDHLVISVYDGGLPIPFRGGWQTATAREALLRRALDQAAADGVMLASMAPDQRWLGQVRGDRGERYLAAVQPLNTYRAQRGLVLLQDMTGPDAQRIAQRYRFAAITLSAMAVMAAFGYLFTARAMRPIAQAYAKQNAFVAAASHELRTPLQVMQSSLDALSHSPPDPARFVRAMQGEVGRMSRLADDLLNLTQFQAQRPLGPVELGRLAREAAKEHWRMAGEKDIALAVAAPEQLPLALGDEAMLRRAINVLLDNALCYTPPHGRVTLRVAAGRQALLLHVEDDGPGIAPNHLRHIFEPFYRADRSRSDRAHSGLGLSIASQIAAFHGGQLTYQPASPQGSRFTLRLPQA